jgi:hypothetical protein
MKRLLFAGIIFLFVPAFAQTKAGKMDTVKHAVFYSCSAAECANSAAAPAGSSSKEQNGKQVTKTGKGVICIHGAGKRTLNRSSKEIMKGAITGN